MSSSSNNSDPYVPCIRGKHALGELVLVQKRPLVEPKEEADAVSKTPKLEQGIETTPEATSMTPTSSTSTPASSPGYHKRRKRINRRWGHSRGREWKAAAASPTVAHSPSSTVAMQPELDDVEGLLFVSFTSKVKHYKLQQNDLMSPKDSFFTQSRSCVSAFLRRGLLLHTRVFLVHSNKSPVKCLSFNFLLCDRKLLRFTLGSSQSVAHHQHLQFP